MRSKLERYSLLAWIATACVLFLAAPAPPPPAEISAEESQAMARAANFVVRDGKHWQSERGDLQHPWPEARGHLVIVIDDVGRELHVFEKLLSLRFSLTFSILPGSVYAAGTQLRLADDRRRYREVLLHLPMEPLDAERMRQGAEAQEDFLEAQDSAQELRAKLTEALERVPSAIGVNNHMGSMLTTQRQAMDALMPVLKQRGLVFLDSRTTAETSAHDAAVASGVPAMARKVFLDNEINPPAIAAALSRAAQLSQQQPVVAIGHPSVELYDVLRQELPKLHEAGVSVYPLSVALAHRYEVSRAIAPPAAAPERPHGSPTRTSR